MLRINLSTALLILTITSVAQVKQEVTLKANDRSIRYDWIKPSHYFNKLSIFDSAGNVSVESVGENFIQVDSLRKEVLFIRSYQYAPGKFLVDSSLNNYSGSVSYVLYTSAMTKHQSVIFHPTSVEAHSVVKGVVADKTTAMEEGYFDDNSIAYVLPCISFQKGVSYRFNCYGTDIHTQNQIPYTVEYVFDDFMPDPNGHIEDCRVLHMTYTDVSSYYWIDKKTHHTLKVTSHGKNFSFIEFAI
jgi:hypothetical protein